MTIGARLMPLKILSQPTTLNSYLMYNLYMSVHIININEPFALGACYPCLFTILLWVYIDVAVLLDPMPCQFFKAVKLRPAMKAIRH